MACLMIIDDDSEIVENLSTLLKGEGHLICSMNTVNGAEENILRIKPDLLILDVMFPENPTAGFDFARQIRRNKKLNKLPILMLTNVNQEFPMNFSASDIDAKWMPVQDFMEKPIKPSLLIKKIALLLK
jgi:DNA-binding response OmpR family regulator